MSTGDSGTSSPGASTPTPDTSIMTTLATLRDAAVAAIALSDWATAYNKLVQADAIIALTPDSEHSGSIMEWRDQIESLLNRVENEKLKLANGGNRIRRTLVTYVRPS